jgi:hypothetical protein
MPLNFSTSLPATLPPYIPQRSLPTQRKLAQARTSALTVSWMKMSPSAIMRFCIVL